MTANVEQPKHPMHALTTFEHRDHRRHLEAAIAFFEQQDPVPSARVTLRAALDKVIASRTTARDWPVPEPGYP